MKYALLGLASLGFCLAAACAADPIYDGESDLTITSNDPARNYAGYQTYRLAEDVAELCSQGSELPSDSEATGEGGDGGAGGSSGGCDRADHSLDATVIAALESEMKALGYKRLDADDEDADLLLLPAWMVNSTWDLARTFCYPFTLQPGCVPPLTAEGITLARRANTPLPPLVLQLIDASDSKGEALVPIWSAAIDRQEHSRPYGTTALGGADAGNLESLIEEGVSTAFAQSAYLNQGAAK